jgi:hypothetical protein
MSATMSSRAVQICPVSAAEISPTSANMRAWAWLANTSCLYSRRSTEIDSVNCSTRASVVPLNRPPHVFWLIALLPSRQILACCTNPAENRPTADTHSRSVGYNFCSGRYRVTRNNR